MAFIEKWDAHPGFSSAVMTALPIMQHSPARRQHCSQRKWPMRRIAEPSASFQKLRLLRQPKQPAKIWVMQRLMRAKICSLVNRDITIPWTDAGSHRSRNMVAYQWAKCFRNSAQLNGEIRNTAPRVHRIRFDDRPGQANGSRLVRRRICRNLPRPAGRPAAANQSAVPRKE